MQEPDPDRSEVRDRYESHQDPPTDGYANYGDANPGPHGGVWVTYDDGEWTAYETVQSADVGFENVDPEDYGDQYVTLGYVQWRDLVTEDGDWTDRAASFVGTFHKGPDSPMAAVVNGRMTGLAAWYATERARPASHHGDGRVQAENYDAVLDKFGIDPIE